MTTDDVTTDNRPAELPVACSLDGTSGPERIARWRRLSEHSQLDAARMPDAVVVRYRPDPDVRAELDALAVLEAECCPFLAFTVTDEPDAVLLQIAAAPGSGTDVTSDLNSLAAAFLGG